MLDKFASFSIILAFFKEKIQVYHQSVKQFGSRLLAMAIITADDLNVTTFVVTNGERVHFWPILHTSPV